jgi:hypothetical protein
MRGRPKIALVEQAECLRVALGTVSYAREGPRIFGHVHFPTPTNPCDFVTYQERHIGPNAECGRNEMLKAIGVSSLDELIQAYRARKGIRSPKALDVGPALTEREHLDNMKALGAKNKVFRSYIGLGFSGTVLPPADPAQHLREPRMVHGLYTVSGGDLARPLGSPAELPDHGERPHRPAHRQCIIAG